MAIHKHGRYEAPNHGNIQKQVKAAHWIFDGGMDEVKTVTPKCTPLEGGYIVLLASSDGGVRIGAVNAPMKYCLEKQRILSKTGITVIRVAITKPWHNYMQLKKRVVVSLKGCVFDGVCYYEITVEKLKQRVDEILD